MNNEALEVACPYCGEVFDLAIDDSAGAAQSFTSDCEVCCRPIRFTVTVAENGEVDVKTRTESGD